MNNFQIVNADTDSISFCKEDQSEFSDIEKQYLIGNINELSPDFMEWSDDGYYKKVIVLKAKNYILYDPKAKKDVIKIKGSALKSSKTEPALKEFLKDIINEIIIDQTLFKIVYEKYVAEILNLKDISRWATKKTITSKVLEGTRLNETKVVEAIKGTDYSEGDKIYLYYDKKDNLKKVENYNDDHNIKRLLKRLYDTSKIFDNIILKGTFKNYSLVKNMKELGLWVIFYY